MWQTPPCLLLLLLWPSFFKDLDKEDADNHFWD